MPGVFQTSVNSRVDLRQIFVDIQAGEVGQDVDIPLMDEDTFAGQPAGLLLALTTAGGSPAHANPLDPNDQVQLMRVIPVNTSSADVILKSKSPDGTVSFSSPAFSITAPNSPDPGLPIFACKRGDRLAVNSDVETQFILQVAMVGRYGV